MKQQAGLVTKTHSFREIFTAFFLFIAVAVRNYRLDFKQSRHDLCIELSKLNHTALEKHRAAWELAGEALACRGIV
jgi:hypothetical protein